MSAFVVDNSTIVRILDFIKDDVLHGMGRYSTKYAPRTFEGSGLAEGQEQGRLDDALQRLGCALLAMNIEAVTQRYPGSDTMPGPIDPDVLVYPPGSFAERAAAGGPVSIFANTALVTREEAHKSISCLIYQCSEGDVPEQELYGQLAKYRDDIAGVFISETKAWDEAQWG